MVAEMRETNERREIVVTGMVAQMKGRQVVEARAMLAEVKAAVADVEDEFTDFMQAHELDTVELNDGTLVTKVEADRRKINAKKLADITTASLYKQVLKTDAIDHKKFDAQVELGNFGKVIVNEVVTGTPYTAIRVTNPPK